MSTLQDRIAQFRKMATDSPDDDLGHFRLGQLLMEDGQCEEAVKSFRRALEISPTFSKVYQLLGSCLIKLNRRDDAVTVLRDGFKVADERGDNVPREEMTKLLVQLGETAPVSQRANRPRGGTGGGFECQRPGCFAGGNARRLAKAPINDELGKLIQEKICADCWDYWLRNLSVKVINEMRLDLSTEKDCANYDHIMRETLGI